MLKVTILIVGVLFVSKPLRLIALVASLLFALAFAGCSKSEPVTLDLPEQWQEFNRTALYTKDEAIKRFQKEHEKKIAWKDGIVGEYTDGKARVTIWVGVGANDGHASQMFLDMAAKIGKENKVFAMPKPVDLGFKAYKTEGQENQNIFYFKGRKVFWIAVNGSADPEGLVKRIYQDFN
jgi:hypothetical protein